MAVSAARLEANRRNSQKSTGPKTAAGKAVSRTNAVRHGLRAKVLIVEFGANSQEVEQERQAWVEALGPTNIIAHRLADVAFRSHRLWQHAVDTEDALIAARTRRASRLYDKKRDREIARAAQQFLWLPEQSLAVFEASAEGCRVWLQLVEEYERAFLDGDWTKSMHDALQYLSGGLPGALDEGLRLASQLVLGYEKLTTLAADPNLGLTPPAEFEMVANKQRAHFADPENNPPATAEDEAIYRDSFMSWTRLLEGVRANLEVQIKELRPDWESSREVIASVFSEIKGIIHDRLEQIETEGDQDVRRRIVIERAKVDTSLEGRLRHRYVADALRDLLKALKAAQEACGTKLADLVPAPQADEIDSDPETIEAADTPAETASVVSSEKTATATPSPLPNEANEPMSDRSDLDDDAGVYPLEIVATEPQTAPEERA